MNVCMHICKYISLLIICLLPLRDSTGCLSSRPRLVERQVMQLQPVWQRWAGCPKSWPEHGSHLWMMGKHKLHVFNFIKHCIFLVAGFRHWAVNLVGWIQANVRWPALSFPHHKSCLCHISSVLRFPHETSAWALACERTHIDVKRDRNAQSMDYGETPTRCHQWRRRECCWSHPSPPEFAGSSPQCHQTPSERPRTAHEETSLHSLRLHTGVVCVLERPRPGRKSLSTYFECTHVYIFSQCGRTWLVCRKTSPNPSWTPLVWL